MLSRRAEYIRRAARLVLPAALLALSPKCALCLLAYAGLGTAVGLGGREWCGTPPNAPLGWATSLAWLGLVGAITCFSFFLAASRRAHAVNGKPSSPSR